ncbi:MAG: hypothetical protein U9R79_18695 [Armatimonadota bacterium]|nr:hypothetical protein [Armatimonadota bacterium]
MRPGAWKIAAGVAIAAIAAVVIATVMRLQAPSGDAMELARSAAEALGTVAVRGVVVTEVRTPKGLTKSRAQVHRGDGHVHIEYLSGPAEGMEVRRQEDMVWARGPQGLRRHAQVGDAGWSERLLARNWQFRVVGRGEVAGRTVRIIEGSGPGGGVRVSVDEQTSFPLAMRRTDTKGRTVSATTWEEADFSVEPPPKVELPEPAEHVKRGRRRHAMALADVRAEVTFTLLRPEWLPEGFSDEQWFLHDRPRSPIVELRYTDGLRPLLVIQRKARRDRPASEMAGPRGPRWSRTPRDGHEPRGRRGHGRMRRLRGAGGDAVQREVDGTMAVVAGPLSAAELERIADSLQPVQ